MNKKLISIIALFCLAVFLLEAQAFAAEKAPEAKETPVSKSAAEQTPTKPEADKEIPVDLPNEAPDTITGMGMVKGISPKGEEYQKRLDAQNAREAERKKKIAEAIEKDTSILKPRQSPLDFSNEALTLGEPYLGSGPIKEYGLSWFGDDANYIRPRAQFYGTFSTFMFGGRVSDRDLGQLGYNLNLDLNVDLTNTERFHFRYRPFIEDDAVRSQTGGLVRFHESPDDTSTNFHEVELSIDNTFAWFEGEIGEMFDFLAPRDEFPTDYHIAVGILPVNYQNLYLMNDNVLGVLLSKPNIVAFGATNIVLQGMYAFEEINATRAGGDPDNRQNNTDLYGFTARVEFPKQFWELNYFHQDALDSGEQQDWAAIALASNYGLINYTFRALFNFKDDRVGGGTAGNGQLYVFEFNRPVLIKDYYDKNYAYLNVFYGTEGWNDIARGRTARSGILFRGNGVTSFATVRNTGTGAVGGSAGLKMFYLREALTINPELSWLFDIQDSASGAVTPNDQYALGMEVQYLLSNHISLVGKMVGVHNEIRNEDWGSSIEMRFKF